MNSSTTYTMQVITGQQQLEEAFSLRYRMYKTNYPLLVAHHATPFEWDAFDNRSIHVGLYSARNQKKELVGYCRLIIPPAFSNVLTDLPVLDHAVYTNLCMPAQEKLAFIKQLSCKEDIKRVNDLCTGLEQNNQFYIEASRLIIDDEHRNILLSHFFITGIFALGKLLDLEYFFISCTWHHVAFYKRFGLALLPYEAEYGTVLQPKKHVILAAWLSTVDFSVAALRDAYDQLLDEGSITFRKAA